LYTSYLNEEVNNRTEPSSLLASVLWFVYASIVSAFEECDEAELFFSLMSRDEQNVLVVSYSELKRCLEQAFGECVSASRCQRR